MRVLTERCWHGNNKYSFRLTVLDRGRPAVRLGHVYGYEWNRDVATRARNLVQEETGCQRDSIKWEWV